ncbi:EscU/YscU/HrcU family type III secretion system export apparatus switch protein [Lichenicoccus roseus]|uniref:EscU/YscU/HrcU family type III secretion system export apparatus switch protein n=1 Tax=Lichenicoccus roseus TaxID=2683649 RepID=A0A5R9J693_9PROT|nr:EscU/YscU/HrcU family type III secretion system export apparatus switch protein [Lichenicoccus roseus]TLU73134.1 EscU/YscU/HrcU family type III secretion system export apparatus switch protein [Lichenicoccus roseus]
MADREDKTEAPSAKRLAKAREDGQVAISREVQALSGIGVAVLAMMMTLPDRAGRFVMQMRGMMANVAFVDLSGNGAATVWREALMASAAMAGPAVLAAAAGALVVTVLQTGLLLRPTAMMPQFSRVSPMRGLQRIFGGETAVEAGKAVVKLIAFAMALRHVLAGLLPVLWRSSDWDAGTLAARALRLSLDATLMLLAVQGAIAVLDVMWVRYRHTSKLRMSKQELRDEFRESEGDQLVKGRIKQMRRQRASRRMMDQVPKATVVVTNPTHYAVALVYETGGKSAPKLVAKGAGEIAARIRELAMDNKVPLVSNPPLARALYALPLDAEIPREHFQAVAGIIAYVWRLRRPPPGPPAVR